MHAVLKGLGITDQAISFVVDSSNGNKVKSSRAQGSLAKGPTPPDPVAGGRRVGKSARRARRRAEMHVC